MSKALEELAERLYECHNRAAGISRTHWSAIRGNPLCVKVVETYLALAHEASAATHGVALIQAERQRQIEKEKWSAGHDDEHDEGQLARAAATYALPANWRLAMLKCGGSLLANLWPWDNFWKESPEDRIRELAKAGALIAAEIDRLQRLLASSAEPSQALPQ